MEMSRRRLLQVMQMAVGWLTQDHMSQSVQRPSPDVVVTTDNLLHIWISPSNVRIYYHVSRYSTCNAIWRFYGTFHIVSSDHMPAKEKASSQNSTLLEPWKYNGYTRYELHGNKTLMCPQIVPTARTFLLLAHVQIQGEARTLKRTFKAEG
jgi:hypothetical protein